PLKRASARRRRRPLGQPRLLQSGSPWVNAPEKQLARSQSLSTDAGHAHPATPVTRRDKDQHRRRLLPRPSSRRTPMRPQLSVFSTALLCAPAASATQPAGQPGPLDGVLGQLQDSRVKRASNPKQAKISPRLLPPPPVGPLVGGLVAAPPPLGADGMLHVYL